MSPDGLPPAGLMILQTLFRISLLNSTLSSFEIKIRSLKSILTLRNFPKVVNLYRYRDNFDDLQCQFEGLSAMLPFLTWSPKVFSYFPRDGPIIHSLRRKNSFYKSHFRRQVFILDGVQEVNSGLVLKKKGTANKNVQISKTSFLCREV